MVLAGQHSSTGFFAWGSHKAQIKGLAGLYSFLEGEFGAEFSSLLFVLELRLCFLANCQPGLP